MSTPLSASFPESFFSDDVHSFFRSPVRDIFRKVDLSAICSFAGGYPSAETFPVSALESLVATVIRKYGAQAFQYGATQGVPELRSALARRYGVGADEVQVTTSSQQGIDVVTRILVNPGDVVITSAPTYLGALQSFASYRADVVGVTPASDGPAPFAVSCGRALESCLASGRRVKMLYVIPDFQNPSGETLSLAERRALADLARRHNILILEDSPYRELRYEGEPLPTLYSLCPEQVVHLGSFSKIFAPGFRLGWMIGPAQVLDKVYVCKQSLDLCPPVLDQYVAAEYLSSGALDANLQQTIALYRSRRDRFDDLLRRYMPSGVTWVKPHGGLFVFLTLPPHVDTVGLYDRALSAGVAYVAGSFFYPGGMTGRNTMRLNYSFIAPDRMEEGVRILADVIRQAIGE